VVGAITCGTYFIHGSEILPFYQHGDHVSVEEQQKRLAAFNALGPMEVTPIPEQGISNAVDAMQLSVAARQALMDELAKSPQTPSIQHSALPDPAGGHRHELRLTWITLWDTDTEDGDVVRIDTQGYSRTVVLKKEPTTFAVPVSQDDAITVTGIRDGDGGGITVGVASGASKAVFPIMSEGEVLSLRVRIR